MWSRDRGLGLETVSRPKKCGLGLGLECTGLGLIRCDLGLGLKGMVLVLGIWSRSCAFGLGLAPFLAFGGNESGVFVKCCRYFRLFTDF